MDKLEFCKVVNKGRLTKTWYTFVGVVEGKQIQLKGHGTWLQIFKVDGVNYGSVHDLSVKAYKAILIEQIGK